MSRRGFREDKELWRYSIFGIMSARRATGVCASRAMSLPAWGSSSAIEKRRDSGARIWNAAVSLGVSPQVLCDPVDTVMFCLSKGLGAPIGSVLCGPPEVIRAARDERARLGGGWRQAGIIADAQ